VRTATETMPLEQANDALNRLRAGAVEGALVLVP
jgi:D-arabinose 1-dehydrogenase-like Zn-dependent alcohol dehydrogenase